MNILVVGSMAYDAIETPFGKTDKILGGAATYIGLSASNYQVPIELVSVVGGDFDQTYLPMLNQKGISTLGVEVRQDEKTFFWSGRYHSNMNERDTLVTELNVLENFQPKVPSGSKKPDILLLGNLHPLVQASVLEQLEERPKLVVMDTMNFWMDIALEDLKNTIQKVDVLVINDQEARQLSGEYSLLLAAKIIQQMGPKFLIIKKGEHGAMLFEGENYFVAPAILLDKVIDPTGAGDTFAGGFVGYLAQVEKIDFGQMKMALLHGTTRASFCVEELGTKGLMEIEERAFDQRLSKLKDSFSL
ncbi:MAG: sugar kinase [Flavobacteriaceae bacterium]|nr:MAG: sugar kinase [Flavobacteriaceae bacterium]